MFVSFVCLLLYTLLGWNLSEKVAFDPQLLPPSHMPIVYGPVKSRKAKAETLQKDIATDVGINRVCAVCNCMLLVC